MRQKRPKTPKMTSGLVQHVALVESVSIQWVNIFYQVLPGHGSAEIGNGLSERLYAN